MNAHCLLRAAERESIAHTMQSVLDEATDPWGVKVERVEMWVLGVEGWGDQTSELERTTWIPHFIYSKATLFYILHI